MKNDKRPEGIESGIAMLDRMLACGEIDQTERMRAAHAHLAAVYEIAPCDCEWCSTSGEKP